MSELRWRALPPGPAALGGEISESRGNLDHDRGRAIGTVGLSEARAISRRARCLAEAPFLGGKGPGPRTPDSELVTVPLNLQRGEGW